MEPHVSIVILNWNNFDDTADCLQSLEGIGYANYDVIVVDNGSEDDSIGRLRKQFPEPTYIRIDSNRGFAAGNNVGIRHALNRGAEYVLLLNNDTIVPSDFLEPLVTVAETTDEVGIVSGVIERHDSDEIWYAGATFYPSLLRASHERRIVSENPYPTDYITGALMLIKKDVMQDIGLLNEDFFFGMEDVEFSNRAKEEGWEIRVVPESRIEHKVSGTAGENSQFWLKQRTKNRFYYANKHLDSKHRILFYCLFIVETIFLGVYWTITRKRPIARLKVIIEALA